MFRRSTTKTRKVIKDHSPVLVRLKGHRSDEPILPDALLAKLIELEQPNQGHFDVPSALFLLV